MAIVAGSSGLFREKGQEQRVNWAIPQMFSLVFALKSLFFRLRIASWDKDRGADDRRGNGLTETPSRMECAAGPVICAFAFR
jgi:hypothetical protein